MKRLPLLVAAAVIAGAQPVALAQQLGQFDEVLLVPTEGTSFALGARSYSGELRVRALSDGLSLVEFVDIDGYLAGVREVPATWPEAALDAQAVAARTYLAWTLSRGRSESAGRYDFDICATTQCQVYAGTGAGEPRWVEAVARTAGEVLLYDGSPAQTMYFSTSGGQTEPIEDIFSGATPKPYLSGVPSPGETSPFVGWSVSMPARAFVDVLDAAGIRIGELISMDVEEQPQGGGVWDLAVVTSEGTVRLPVSRIRSIFNRYGPELYPELLPGERPDGRRYPQTVLSYRFEVLYVPLQPLDTTLGSLPVDDRPVAGSVVFDGRGWGHHVGMSQYGALAMAEAGDDYATILGHYYGGLEPATASGVVPDVVAVGLDWGAERFVVRADGPFTLVADGRPIDVGDGGAWILAASESGEISAVSGDMLLNRLLGRFSKLFPVL